jgi:DNA-binding CsgD family transcriptional regulator
MQSLADFMQTVEAPINLAELFKLINSSQNTCVFIKNEHSSYRFANNNYVQFMGLKNINQLRTLNDYDISKNKNDADLYRELDQHTLEEGKPLAVSETISPNFNQPIAKTMQGHLYPLYTSKGQSNYVLGIVIPECRLLKLDFDTIFKLSQQELNEQLIKRSYTINLNLGSINLSKMEIRTLVQLLKGAHAGEIAQQLSLKQTTVESYLANIKYKLGVYSKGELINLIVREKLLEQIII